MKRGKPIARQRRVDPDRARRNALRAELVSTTSKGDDVLQWGGPHERGTTTIPPRPMRQRKPATPTEALARAVRPGAVAELAAAGVDVGVGGVLTIGRLGFAHAGPGAPLRVQLITGLAFPKPHRVTAPSWLKLVRMMPCAIPGCRRGRAFYQQLQVGTAQSEANHHPGRGRAAGGSDLETHPVCPPCHKRITEHSILVDYSDEACTRYVQEAIHTVLVAVRDGYLDPGVVLAAWVEMVIAK